MLSDSKIMQVECNLLQLITYEEVYILFCQKFPLDGGEPYDKEILQVLRNAILSALYLCVRRLLSKGNNSEVSIYTLLVDDRSKPEDIIRNILPNSYDTYERLKKYVDKSIAHTDIGSQHLNLDDLLPDAFNILCSDLYDSLERLSSRNIFNINDIKNDVLRKADKLFSIWAGAN